MDLIVRFGYGGTGIAFDTTRQVSVQADFGDKLAESVRRVGRDGGYYKWGLGGAPRSVGTVQLYHWLTAGDASEMAGLRRDYMGMQNWGMQPLVKQMMDGVYVWTWGEITNIQMPQSAKNVPHRLQQVQVNWHCPTSRWYGHGSTNFLSDDGGVIAGGIPLVAPKVDRVDVGNGDTVSITNAGDVDAGCYIRWEAPTGVTITNPTLSRDNVYGTTVDSVQYTGAMDAGDVVDIDGRNHVLMENQTVIEGGYDKLTVSHGGWMVIPPGTWTLDVSGTFSGGDGKLTVDCWDVYV